MFCVHWWFLQIYFPEYWHFQRNIYNFKPIETTALFYSKVWLTVSICMRKIIQTEMSMMLMAFECYHYGSRGIFLSKYLSPNTNSLTYVCCWFPSNERSLFIVSYFRRANLIKMKRKWIRMKWKYFFKELFLFPFFVRKSDETHFI